MKNHRKISAVVLGVAALCLATPVWADGAGAFLGGMVTSRVLGNMQERNQIEQQQAYSQQQQAQAAQYQARAAQPVQQAAPAPASQSPKQKLDELDKLAAGGYITKEEYKQKKQAIIDSM